MMLDAGYWMLDVEARKCNPTYELELRIVPD
jgi:hypothetical protein